MQLFPPVEHIIFGWVATLAFLACENSETPAMAANASELVAHEEDKAAQTQPAGQDAPPKLKDDHGRLSQVTPKNFGEKLADAALKRTRHQVRYDPAYVRLEYPGGDVPPDTGVCADVIIRSYRALGMDLQKKLHEDMRAHFHHYPKIWGLRGPDRNIDHRRVPNLRRFFERHGESLAISSDTPDYLPGDLVTYNLKNQGSLPHIVIVSAVPAAGDPNRYQIIHNIGAGPKLEDRLFAYKITGHYRYNGEG